MTGQAFELLETTIYDGCMSIVGNPIYLGLVIVGFFLGFIILQGSRMDVKLLIMIPALFLAASYIPVLTLILTLGVGAVLFLAVSRLFKL